MLFSSKEKAELTGKVAGLESQVADLTASLAALTTERDAAQASLASAQASHTTALATAQAAHEAALATAKESAEADKQRAIVDALASAGHPEGNLPAAANGPSAESSVSDLEAQLETTTDPGEAGKLVAKLKLARAAAAAAKLN